MADKVYKAWHFVTDEGETAFGRIPVEMGETYSLPESQRPILCEQGFHGSTNFIDALGYSQGNIVCRVEIWGDVTVGDDKLVGRHRKVLSMTHVETLANALSLMVGFHINRKIQRKGLEPLPLCLAGLHAKQQWMADKNNFKEYVAARGAANMEARRRKQQFDKSEIEEEGPLVWALVTSQEAVSQAVDSRARKALWDAVYNATRAEAYLQGHLGGNEWSIALHRKQQVYNRHIERLVKAAIGITE